MTSFSGFLGISILMDLVSISLDLIHVFERESLVIDCFYNHFRDFSISNTKVSILVVNTQTLSSKRFRHYFKYKALF